MKVYVAWCRYDGCEEFCTAGVHILGVYTNEPVARSVCKEHEKHKEAHTHWFTTDVEEFELDKGE